MLDRVQLDQVDRDVRGGLADVHRLLGSAGWKVREFRRVGLPVDDGRRVRVLGAVARGLRAVEGRSRSVGLMIRQAGGEPISLGWARVLLGLLSRRRRLGLLLGLKILGLMFRVGWGGLMMM